MGDTWQVCSMNRLRKNHSFPSKNQKINENHALHQKLIPLFLWNHSFRCIEYFESNLDSFHADISETIKTDLSEFLT